ncbi:MAG TPA: hypothetical protein VE033_09630 [Acetobacteraceae bacterium]|nr:hypothetical protein [Acetobacteraceae bacterium]
MVGSWLALWAEGVDAWLAMACRCSAFGLACSPRPSGPDRPPTVQRMERLQLRVVQGGRS